ncbi:cilia- and flagella-associated protein 65 isoform X1 [Pantherophis guttatus]|uniref:Cilia- and flagella-associated protein 65 isoform X1 n=2 Tax=Pantherophis guttatus TaxID=94885 RepID=A0A6P9DE03_PANGU|nr:cilia- and flagella-associated protein 65 isoform X1 [Pantherophis guttatus]
MLTHLHGCTAKKDSIQRLCHNGTKQTLMGISQTSLDSSVRKPKKNIFWGIEVAETLNWQRWSLGREFTKHLILRNVCLKPQKLKFRPPTTRFFITIFPQPIILTPGMSLTLPIIFRPLERREYEDSILFEKPEGEFSVALLAKLPHLELLFPHTIQLPACAVHHFVESSFPLYNNGDLLTCFSWEVPEPFFLVPSRGMLDPGEECIMKVTFQPEMALVYDVLATCTFGDNQEQKTLKLKAVGKYPHLLVNVPEDTYEDIKLIKFRDVLSFGSVAVDSTVEREMEILNVSVVDAPFRIERTKEPMLRDRVFSCDVTQAIVKAGGTSVIPVRFSPHTVGVKSVDYFTIVPSGSNTHSVLKVTGSCKGPAVTFLHPFVYFSYINLGEYLNQPLDIINNSDVPAYYQFDIDCTQSVFSIDRPYGVLNGMSTITLKVTFQPTHPIICYRRVVCLVHHQDPLFLDLVGTCHTETTSPNPLRMKDLSRYRTHMARGLTFFPPDILGTMLKEGKLLVDENGALTLPPEMLQDKPPEEYPVIEPLVEYFHDGVYSDLTIYPPHVSLSIKEFDFGCCASLREIEPLPFSVTNHTKGKVSVIWTRKPDSPFQVMPECCDIPSLKSMAFRITFQPPQVNTLYAAELEGFAFYKVLRHYNNVEEPITMCPSWSLTIRLRGHTFQPGRQHFIPRFILDCHKVFPPVCRNVSTYCSMLLRNVGTTAISFNIGREKCPSVLVKPSCGYIIPGAHQIFFLSTCPTETTIQQHTLLLNLNFWSSFTQEIFLQSNAEPLALLLEGDGNLYFKPTCVGTCSSRTFTIKNCTRLPMLFRWKIQKSDQKLLSVQPAEGTLLPNEALAQTWTFTPAEQIKYLLRSWVIVWRDQEMLDDKTPKTVRYVLRVIGEGSFGTITAEEKQIDVGKILVGSSQSCNLVLFNNGSCCLKYVLSVEQSITGPCDPEEVASDPLAIELDHYKGTVWARGKIYLQATLKPAHQLCYTWTIYCAISTPKAANPLGEKLSVCCVVATGIYPSICIVDACGTGSASGISKLHLWRLFSLERLNQYLEREPTPQELTFRVPTRHSTQRIPPVYTPVMVDFNFGAAPVGCESSVVVLMIQNNGTIPVNWDFLFPSDQKIDMEYWAESTEFDPSELHQMRIQDNQLFTVAPKSGKLPPGQEQIIQLSYRHDFVGTDRLPVLLKVSHGREILLNFIGVTLRLGCHYIHFTSSKHMFTPIAIGTYNSPKQIYELYNGGSTSAIYEIQMDALLQAEKENHHHAVFTCLNPRGEIGPGLTAHTEWIFCPLEAKMYSVDVPIHILDGDSALITFQGVGFDPQVMGETAQFDKVVSAATTPVSAKLTVPGLAVYLSQPRICLGNIPVYSKCSRLFFLNNASEDEAIIFTWHVPGISPAMVALKIIPQTGIVQAGESTHCVLTLHAGENPCFYNVDLICEIFTQNSLDQYEKELQEWETENARQAVEFTITEKDLDTMKDPKEPFKGAPNMPGLSKFSKVFTKIRKYKTLPPIKNICEPNAPASRSQRRQIRDKEASRFWPKPEFPKPFLMHLGFTARSHSIDDFLSNFSSDLPQHFLYRQLKKKRARKDSARRTSLFSVSSKTGRGSIKDVTWMDLENCTEQEAQLLTDMLSMVIKGLLEETQFQEAVARSLTEPIPYFYQFWSEKSAKQKKSPTGSSPETPSPELIIKGRTDDEDLGRETVTPRVTSFVTENLSVIIRKEQSREEKEFIIRMPAFANVAEMVLDNTIQNILVEASRGEVVLTARPRIIALSPVFSQKGVSPIVSMHRSSGTNTSNEIKNCEGQRHIVLAP